MSDAMNLFNVRYFKKEWAMDPPSFVLEKLDDRIRTKILDINAQHLAKIRKIELQISQLVHEMNTIGFQRDEEVAKVMQVRG